MDPDIIAWVIEFLIRQQIPALFLNAILTDPRFSVRETKNTRCKKTICLRTIQDEIAEAAVSSESILESLEIIEELDRKEGNLITDSMKLAYRAAAVECTVKYLRSPGKEDEGQFFEAVKRIWRGRIEKLELLKKSELVTDELREIKEEMEAALWDPKACQRLLAKVGQTDAVRLVRDYVNEALVIMGPSFVELATRAEIEMKLKRKDGDKVEMKEGSKQNAGPEVVVLDGAARQDLKRRRKDGDEVEMEEGNKSNAGPEIVVSDGPARQDGDEVETEEGSKADAGPELVVLDGPAGPETGEIQQNDVFEACRPETTCDIMDSQRVEARIPPTKFSLLPTPEVMKLREALNRSCMELKALVNDPLPEALRVSDVVRAEIREKTLNKENSVENQNGNDIDPPSPPINAEVSRATTEILNPPTNAEVSRAATEILNPVPSQVIQNMNTNAEIPMPSHQNLAPKRSLMERNSTACTFEWNDSIDGISQEVANSMDTDNLPAESSRKKLASYKVKNVVGRRPSKRWSVEEEDGLREGVKKFGAGNWKLILNSKRDLFVDRKAVDLKDKWRNMTKYSEWQRT